MTLAGVGDCQISTRHSACQDKAFLDLVRILREADVAYANLEHLVHDYGPECYPGARSGGTYTGVPAYLIDEFKWMGIDFVSCATNHAYDYMVGGIKETIRNLDERELPHAGIGVNLAEARAPGFFDSSQGRVALISVAIGSDIGGIASDARRDMQGKPGINLLRISKEYTLDSETFAMLRNAVNRMQPLGLIGRRDRIPDDAKEFEVTMGENLDGVIGTKFILGDKVDVRSVCFTRDIEGNLDIIDDAKRQADWVFIACHHHHNDGTDGSKPSKAAQSFAHACIDAGADGWIGSGPHQIQGVEVYGGRPIIYSLPDFIQQRDLQRKSPQIFYEIFGLGFENTPMDAMDQRAKTQMRRLYSETAHAESGLAVLKFKRHEITDMKLVPADLGFQKPRWQFGRPALATGELAQRIIARWAKLSEAFGTKIDFKDGIGIVRIQ